jgi:hypothetical protein
MYYKFNNENAKIEMSNINASLGSNVNIFAQKSSQSHNEPITTFVLNTNQQNVNISNTTMSNESVESMTSTFSHSEQKDPFALTLTTVTANPRYPLDLTFVKESNFIIRAAVRTQDAGILCFSLTHSLTHSLSALIRLSKRLIRFLFIFKCELSIFGV